MPHARGGEAPARDPALGRRARAPKAAYSRERYLMYANHLLALLFTATTPRARSAAAERQAARGLTRELRSSFAY